MNRRFRGATSTSPINPHDYSEDPSYGYKPLSFHARRAIADATTDRQAARRAMRRAA